MFVLKKSFVLLLVILFAVVGFDSLATAQNLHDDFTKPMPDLKSISQEEFNKSSVLHEVLPSGFESLSYKLKLPKKWTRKDTSIGNLASLSSGFLSDIDRYFGPPNIQGRSYFSVQAEKIEHKMTAEQWLILYMVENGYTIEGFEVHNDNRAEVLFVSIDNDVTYIVNAVVQLTGDKAIFAQLFIPSKEWKQQASTARLITGSFELDSIEDEQIEQFDVFHFLDIAEIAYPESWKLVAKPLKSVDEMEVSLLSVGAKNQFSSKNILKGKIDVALASDYVIDDLEEAIKQHLKDKSVEHLLIQDAFEEHEDFTVNENIRVEQIKTYSAVDRSKSSIDYEYWLGVFSYDEYYYLISLLTPSRTANFPDWVRNTQTFRSVVQSAKPLL